MSLRPFEEIVAEHGEVVMRVCRALLGASDAEDAWSETFLAALRRYTELPPGSNVKGWLVTIAHNKSIDLLRSRTRRPVPGGDPPAAPQRAVAVPRTARAEVLGGRAGERHPRVGVRVPPVELGDGADPAAPQERGQPQRHEPVRTRMVRGQVAHRGGVEVIVVIVRLRHRVDRRIEGLDLSDVVDLARSLA